MRISQTVSSCNVPRLRDAMALGGDRQDWERILDGAWLARHDEAVLRVLESEARREELRRDLERRLVRFAAVPPACSSVAQPNVFFRLFRKNIGGVASISDCWFDTSFVAVDGVTGKLQSWIDYVDNTHLLTQGTSTKQAALPGVNANLANALTANFDGSAGAGLTEYVANRAKSFYRYLHDGTAGGVLVVFENVTTSSFRPIASTHDLTASDVGFRMFGNSGGYRATLENGSTTIWNTAIVGTAAASQPTYVSYFYSAAATPKTEFRQKGTLLYSTDPVGSPAAGDSQTALTLGWNLGNITNAPYMKVRSLYSWRRMHNSAERVVRQQFIQKDTGQAP